MLHTTITARDLMIGDAVKVGGTLTDATGRNVWVRGFGGQIRDMITDGLHTLIEWADGTLSLITCNTYVMVQVG